MIVLPLEKLEALAAMAAKPEPSRPSTNGNSNGQFDHRLNSGSGHKPEEVEAPPGKPKARPAFTHLLSGAELLALDLRPRFLVRGVLVDGQPMIIGGRSKVLKTGIAEGLAISLGSGTPFLGRFEAERVGVGFWSGESGAATIRETARRIAESKAVDLADVDVSWCFDLPRLSAQDHLDYLTETINSHGFKVGILDPLYLALLSPETASGASNVFMMGSMLQGLTRLGQQTGCTIILLHHFRKGGQPDDENPAGLEELAQSGVAEWARQWILLQRRVPYQADGVHHLWMGCGGSTGHSSLWGVTVDEGLIDPDTFTGRKWEITINLASRPGWGRSAMSTAIDHRRRQIARLFDGPAPSWRTEPRYEGYCSDGYFLDSLGRLQFRRNPQAAIDLARARLELLLLDDLPMAPPRPLLSIRAIDGRLPSPSKVRAIEAAIDEVPAAIRGELLRAGARIELIAGADVAAHPLFRHHPRGQYAGMTRAVEPFAAVAVDADGLATAMHELGHILDHVAGHPSRGAAGLKIWEHDKRTAKVPSYSDQRQRAAEYFAESCSRLWNPRPGVWPASRAVERFIEGLA